MVDDDPQALRFVRDAWAEGGHQPVVNGDPQEAPRLMWEERPPVVLLDLMLSELAAKAGRVLTYGRLLERVWGRTGGGLRPMRAVVVRLRRRLDEDAERPTYVFNEPLVGYWVPVGETPGEESPATP